MNEPLFDVQMLTAPNAKAFGRMGEQIVFRALERQGYQVITAREREYRGDLVVIDPVTGQVTRIEVKTARPGAQGYQFCLERHGRYAFTTLSHSDVLILMAITRAGLPVPFVIPAQAYPRIKKLTIASEPTRYAGKYARFRQSLDCISLSKTEQAFDLT
ncbi:MAG: hypothetical protein SF162_07560 [bacterium]|nr:hypothetical protein [bacterium]